MRLLAHFFKNLIRSNRKVVKRLDAKQETLVRVGREQFQKMVKISMGLPIAYR